MEAWGGEKWDAGADSLVEHRTANDPKANVPWRVDRITSETDSAERSVVILTSRPGEGGECA